MSTNSKTDLLTTQRSELIKSHSEFDIEGRVEFIYTAPTDADNGTPCTVVQYVYVGAGDMRIVGMKEGKAIWDSTWDTDFTVTTS